MRKIGKRLDDGMTLSPKEALEVAIASKPNRRRAVRCAVGALGTDGSEVFGLMKHAK
jgi:hypothetical protein